MQKKIISIKRRCKILTIFAIQLLLLLLTGSFVFAAENTTVTSEFPYPSTFSNHIQAPKQGDSALEARNATLKKKGTPWKVGKYTKDQLNTMNAAYVLEILTGDSKVYDNKKNYLGTAKEVFNGVWGDLDPAKALGVEKGGPDNNRKKIDNTDRSSFDPNSKKKQKEKLYVPSNAVYVDLRNIKSGGQKYTNIKELMPEMWDEAAQYSAFYDKDYKKVEFTRKNGKTY